MSNPESPSEDSNKSDEVEPFSPQAHFEPVVSLPLVPAITLEEDEQVLLQSRAKLYRFDTSESPSIWKERGTGEIKLLHHPINNTVRVVMRRDKTLKLCANHFITPSMRLQRPNNNKKNWWIWTVCADYADEVSKAEILAIKFACVENADRWERKFLKGQRLIRDECTFDILPTGDEESTQSTASDSSVSDGEVGEDTVEESDSPKNENELSESIIQLNINRDSVK